MCHKNASAALLHLALSPSSDGQADCRRLRRLGMHALHARWALIKTFSVVAGVDLPTSKLFYWFPGIPGTALCTPLRATVDRYSLLYLFYYFAWPC